MGVGAADSVSRLASDLIWSSLRRCFEVRVSLIHLAEYVSNRMVARA